MSLSDNRIATAPDGDERAIRMVMSRIAASWDHSDAPAFASGFTADADYIVFDGTHIRGQDGIADSHRDLFEFFNTAFGGSQLVEEKSGIRFLTPDVALVHATGAVLFPWQKEIAGDRRSINTSVLVRQPDGTWLVAAFQNTRVNIRPLPKGLPLRMLAALFRLRARVARLFE